MRITPSALQEPGLTPIPQEIELKDAFVARYEELFKGEFDRFLCYSTSYARKAIRVNTLKISVKSLRARLKNWQLDEIPWCPEGFALSYKKERRFDVGNLPEHQLGYLYVQDPASMIPPIVLDPQPGELILDQCAAPGSKTTQIAMYMQNQGVLIANDISGERLKPLGLNLQRCGVLNTIVTMRAGKLRQVFDRVLVDAPCSATGTIRRSLKTLHMWSPQAVERMAREQARIMHDAWTSLKAGGIMVYSTCTLEPQENEGNVSAFLSRHNDADLEDIKLNIRRRPAVTEFNGVEYDPRVHRCLRIAPQDNDTEGFFVAKFRKLTS